MRVIESLRRARNAYALGIRLQTAVERGRRLHPWMGVENASRALADEVSELASEIYGTSRDKEQRITEEAIDCAVVAIRIAERM